MTDTHSHPYLEEFAEGGAVAMESALEAGVRHVVLPNVDASTVASMMRLHMMFPQCTSVALGLHPTEVKEDWKEIVASMGKTLSRGGFCAVGEVGIDLYWDKSRRDLQVEAFKRQLEIAGELQLPVIIHNREALDDTLSCIRPVSPEVPLVFHSFTGNREDVDRIREVCDPYFGINGVVTYKNAQPLRDSLPSIGLKRIVLETDAPYLSPVPFRGKQNQPTYIVNTCRKVADVLGVPAEEVESTTDANASLIFGI